ncbi:MAG: GC-type dockerin domain-anchored protein [Phycisphaerales bacterium]
MMIRLLGLLALVACPPTTGAQVSFHPLGDLPGGTSNSRARAVSPDGTVVAGVSESGSGLEACSAPLGGPLLGLGDLPGGLFGSDAFGISSSGGVIVGRGTTSASDTLFEAFRWNAGSGTMSPLGFLTNGYSSTAYAVSADGLVVVGDCLTAFVGAPPPLPAVRAFRWTAADGMVDLGTLPGFAQGPGSTVTARGVSNAGDVVVGYASDAAFQNHPFRWTAQGGMVDLGGGTVTGQAWGCSPDGSVVVGRTTGATLEPFVWTQADGLRLLGLLPGHVSGVAFDATNNVGERLCGLHSAGTGSNTAVIWDRNLVTGGDPSTGWRQVISVLWDGGVDMTGWILTRANAMSDDGRVIVGEGFDPGGLPQGWAAVIPLAPRPCPADFNGSGGLSVQDIFDFLTAYFGDDPRADVNGSGGVSVQDILDYLDLYFTGC